MKSRREYSETVTRHKENLAQEQNKPKKARQNGHWEYGEVLPRIQDAVDRFISPTSTVIVVSKGDNELLKLGSRKAWHFPQRGDGAYLGYYPSDSAAAIKHLEDLRAKGGEYLLFPVSSFWWLEHYDDFRQHLESNYPVTLHHKETCLIFALNEQLSEASQSNQQKYFASNEVKGELAISKNGTEDHLLNDLRALFDFDYYADQAGDFQTFDDALAHYLTEGFSRGYSPNRLFDPAYYTTNYLYSKSPGTNPFIQFLKSSASELQNPNPYFDTEFYYGWNPSLRAAGTNALVHYASNVRQRQAYRPNPLFDPIYYLESNLDVKHSGMEPLSHFISKGYLEGRYTSYIHKNLINGLQGHSKPYLQRGNWATEAVLFLANGDTPSQTLKVLEVAKALGKEYHLRSIVVFKKRTDVPYADFPEVSVIVLEDFALTCEIDRRSALQIFLKSLRMINPIFALVSTCEMVSLLYSENIPAFLWTGKDIENESRQSLDEAVFYANRILFESSSDFDFVAGKLGYRPTNIAMLRLNKNALRKSLVSLMSLAKRDCQLPENIFLLPQKRAADTTNKIVIPCSDWALSGVNSALEAVGKELINLGWEVEILFTRDEKTVAKTTGHKSHLPSIPYSYLETSIPGLEGMWEALIAYLETNAPCIMLMAYDFAANGIAPALTDKVGIVLWAQSDDKDYYEQIYRLGRYCNAIVCVSNHIKNSIKKMNPVIAERARVIHNSSVGKKQIAVQKPRRSKKIRLIYTGRLVQYQKRILDTIDLAEALDKLKLPYEITLVGTFSQRENTQEIFKARAQHHLRDGRIKLAGRLTRDQVLQELSSNDFFILLSEFEGLPLSLVEAMARGCVPIVSDMKSGINEVIDNGQNGLIMKNRNYDKWAAQIVNLWHDSKQFADISKSARKTVAEQFTIEHIGEQFSELFSQVAAEICSGKYARPECLNWGSRRTPTGDVLPPPSLFSLPIQLPGLRGHR